MSRSVTKLTHESIVKARQWYANNSLAMAEVVRSGKIKINGNVEEYCTNREKEAADFLAGVYDHGLSLRQRAFYYQTGECPAILP